MKRVVEYKVTRDIADYTSGEQRLPGKLYCIQTSPRISADGLTSSVDNM